jgi:hypothetical protein
MIPADLKGFTKEGLDALRTVLERAKCRTVGHQWVLARYDPALMWPFNACARCGRIWTENGDPQ